MCDVFEQKRSDHVRIVIRKYSTTLRFKLISPYNLSKQASKSKHFISVSSRSVKGYFLLTISDF